MIIMNRARVRIAAGVAACAVVLAPAAALATSAPAGAPRAAGHAAPSVNIPAHIAGHGAGNARLVNLRALARGRQLPVHAAFDPMRGKDGRPAGASLPVRRATGHKPAPATPGLGAVLGANGGAALPPRSAGVSPPRTPPSTINSLFTGINQASSGCNCQPSDVNAAVGLTQIAETANVTLGVFSKTGSPQCQIGLNTFFGTSQPLSDPKIIYDNFNNRFVMVVTPIPQTSSAAPSLLVAATTASNACGKWFIYQWSFAGPSYPAGALLDQPRLGQDRSALLFSTDNFTGPQKNAPLVDSVAFSVSKALVYTGATVHFTGFNVAFATQPVTVMGDPIAITGSTYYLASVPGSGYDLYRMDNSAGPNPSLVLQASISAPFSAPARQINQPFTSQTLDPNDGRIPWAPVQSPRGFVWFAHGIDNGGFPSIRYGVINTSTNAIGVAVAYHNGSSDDFNPSIGVQDVPDSGAHIWLNWAYTDTRNSVPVTPTVNGVLPGAGVPNLIGTDEPLIMGGVSAFENRFGDYSSVAIDPSNGTATCPQGNTAVTAQQFFTATGQWTTEIASTSFC